MKQYIISYDIGTTGLKTCLFHFTEQLILIDSALQDYDLKVLPNGGVEQNPSDWWYAMCVTTKIILGRNQIPGEFVKGISFCAQMQGLVLVDVFGNPIRMAMSYMDQRAETEINEGLHKGIRVNNINIFKLLKALKNTGVVAASVKDPVWKYLWVKNNEPSTFKEVHKWLDVKEYLIYKCTDQFVMTEDSAFATLLYKKRDKKNNYKAFSHKACKMYGVDMKHLPTIINGSDYVGDLSVSAACSLGLTTNTKVFGGGGDASLIGLGAGMVRNNDTHVYLGTSGWVSTIVNRPILDLKHMIASVIGVSENHYNYFAELETAGKCIEWVKNHLALDEINIYLDQTPSYKSNEDKYKSMYDFMMDTIKDVPPGSNGVIFTPWLHGSRCPFEDANIGGLYFNIQLNTGKRTLIHAVIEGICYHLRWQLESIEEKVSTKPIIRLVGGGALAPLTCQILSDVLGRTIEVVDYPQNVGAVGAALVTGLGLGYIEKLEDCEHLVKVKSTYTPSRENRYVYDELFNVYKKLYKSNKGHFHKVHNCINKTTVIG